MGSSGHPLFNVCVAQATFEAGGWVGVGPVQGCVEVAGAGTLCGWPGTCCKVQDAVDGTSQVLTESVILQTMAREAGLVHVCGLGLAPLCMWHCGGLPAGIPTLGVGGFMGCPLK